MSNSVLTSSKYKSLRKKINTKYGKNEVILAEDIIQESYLKLLEAGHDITDPRYVMNTAKYITLNAIKVNANHKRLSGDYGYFTSIYSPDRRLEQQDVYLEYKQLLIDKEADIKLAIASPDKTRQVLCVTTGEVFRTSSKAAKAYGISPSMISKNLSGKKKSAGKINGMALQWRRLTKDN